MTSPDCLDDVALSELARGQDPTGQRDARVAHLAGCAHCRAELLGVLDLMGDPAVAAELRRVEPRRRQTRRAFLLGSAVIAASIAAFAILPRHAGDERTPHRALIGAGAAPVQRSPVGEVEEVRSLHWSTVLGATQYRVTLFDAEGNVRLERQTSDTFVVLPDSLVLVPGRSYVWKVAARWEQDRWTASDLLEFRTHPRRVP